MNPQHTHTDDRLTFGCSACISTVRNDQHEALRQEQPLRGLVVTWRAVASERGTTTIEVRTLPGESARSAADMAEAELWRRIDRDCSFAPDDYEIEEAEFGDVIEAAS